MAGWFIRPVWFTAVIFSLLWTAGLLGQDKSVAPDINKAFVKPNIAEFQGKFEVEGREAFEHRDEIVKACRISEGMTVADVGAGTGLFSRLFSPLVGSKGTVLAVDISEDFLRHIHDAAQEQALKNIRTVLCKQDSVELPDSSVDLVFVCDTYHHFEYPAKTLASIHRALKPGGRLIIVDYQRIEGQSTEWVMGHVRAGLEVVEKEITESGFKRVGELKDVLKENYFVEFERVESSEHRSGK
jgi:ubiquinone/menaquinone biosynthesis C-methylase UbiE